MRGPAAYEHQPAVAQRLVASRSPQLVPRCRTARVLGVALLLALVAAGCSRAGPPSSVPVDTDPGLVHVHGLGINPGDGALHAATHTGLFIVRDGDASRVADRHQDTMGFKVVGPDHFTASGRFMVSSDRRRWQSRSTTSLVDFAVSPRDGQVIVATTERGLMRSGDGGRQWRPAGGPAIALLDWDRPEALWGVAGDGRLWVSADAGRTWQRRGELGGPPEAFLAQAGTLYAAVYEQGIRSSSDEGASWRTLYSPRGPSTG